MSKTVARMSAASTRWLPCSWYRTLVAGLLCGLAVFSLGAGAEENLEAAIRDDAPEIYIVLEGDTLWSIANTFLNQPWRWPDLWHVNPEIEDPHVIYPGDMIRLSRENGQVRLELTRGSGSRDLRLSPVRLSPRVRATPLLSNIPSINMEAIGSFLHANRVVSSTLLEEAPYVVQGEAGRILVGASDKLHVRGLSAQIGESFAILRASESFVHPDTGEELGTEAKELGVAQVLAMERDIATMLVTESRVDIRIGDRVVPTEERVVGSTFFPSAPDGPVSGHMLSVLDGVSQIGQYSIVALDLGSREGIKVGHVMAVKKTGELVRDNIARDLVRMPSISAGRLMVFRVFEKVSYGIILEASRPLAVLDEVTNP